LKKKFFGSHYEKCLKKSFPKKRSHVQGASEKEFCGIILYFLKLVSVLNVIIDIKVTQIGQKEAEKGTVMERMNFVDGVLMGVTWLVVMAVIESVYKYFNFCSK
jgi:hypothetical protein